MTILEHTNKIELLKLYKMDTFIGPYSSTWEHKHKKTVFCAWKLLILHVISITTITLLLLPLWHSFIYGFVENWTLNLLKKTLVRKYTNWQRYWENTETAIYSAAPVILSTLLYTEPMDCLKKWCKIRDIQHKQCVVHQLH